MVAYDIWLTEEKSIGELPWENHHLKAMVQFIFMVIHSVFGECHIACSSGDEGYMRISTHMRDLGMDDQDVVSLQEVMRDIDQGQIRRGFMKARSAFWISPPHPNALNAIKGMKAEKLLRTCPSARSALSNYFGKTIQEIQEVPGRKKSDHRIIFEDGTMTTVQQKNGTGGGRGWSFDRRSLNLMPMTDLAKALLQIVCLDRSNEDRSIVLQELSLLDSLLLGDDEQMKPDYFIHTMTNNDNDRITSISISPADVFVKTIKDQAYPNLHAKKTCVHLTPLVYLQRRGGGNSDHSPDDIQAKLKSCPDCMETLTLS